MFWHRTTNKMNSELTPSGKFQFEEYREDVHPDVAGVGVVTVVVM